MSSGDSTNRVAAASWTVVCTGTGGGRSSFNRAHPSTVVQIGERQFLVDCGDGALHQLARFGLLSRLDAVLLTDPSAERLIGLAGVGDWIRQRFRGYRLQVYGPPGTEGKLAALSALDSGLADVLLACEPAPGDDIVGGGLYIQPFPLGRDAGDPGYGYVFFEDPLPGRVDPERAERLGVPKPALAALQRGEHVRGVKPSDVMGPPRPGRRLVIAGRTLPGGALEDAMTGADVALLSAPFIDERLDLAQAVYSMTGWEAAEMAARARTKMLLLQQIAAYYQPGPYRDEARQFHASVFTPTDGDRVVIPIPDNGPPRLEPARGGDRPRAGRGPRGNRPRSERR